MLGGGDELGRTQLGNNNAYCHDSPLSWTPWPGDQDLLAFTRRALALRRAHPQLRRTVFFNGGTAGEADVTWLGPSGLELTDDDWQDAGARALGMWDAINLDGGGSTAMAVRGRLVNRPAGSERSVSDALVWQARKD